MLKTIVNAFRIPELRKKILYTLLILLLFRLCTYIPTPGIDPSAVKTALGSSNIWGIMDVITGGALERYTFMAVGITSYINASIIMQLLTVVIPRLERLSKEGPEGRKKMNQYTRYAGMFLACVQAIGTVLALGSSVIAAPFANHQWFAYILIGASVTAGSALAMWMGERITDRGLGNGISMLIFIGIVAKLPTAGKAYIDQAVALSRDGNDALWWFLIPIILFIIAVITLVIFVDLGERRIPVQYAKRVSGRKMYGGQSTYLPMKPNSAGVMPLIFALSFLTFPSLLVSMFWPNSGFATWYATWLGPNTWGYAIASVIFIIFFAYFYSSITFNPVETANDIQKYGGFIQGIRPGKPTSDYLKRIANRLCLFAGVFLAFISVLPMVVSAIIGQMENSAVILNLALSFGTTGILILTSVSIEIARQLEAQMVMNHYKGFLD